MLGVLVHATAEGHVWVSGSDSSKSSVDVWAPRYHAHPCSGLLPEALDAGAWSHLLQSPQSFPKLMVSGTSKGRLSLRGLGTRNLTMLQ